MEALNDINTADLLNKISKFRKLDFRRIRDEIIVDKLNEIIPYEIFIRYHYDDAKLFYRGRKNIGDNLFLSENDIWAPPASCIKTLGRLNGVGQSMFYASMSVLTIPREIHLGSNEWVTLIKYRIRPEKKLKLVSIGMSFHEHDELSGAEFSKIVYSRLSEKGVINWNILNEFIATEFSREVGIGTEYLYRTSLLISKHFFPLIEGEYDGYLYLSVASKLQYNIAVPPQKAKEILQFEGIRLFRFIKEGNKEGTYLSISNRVWSNKIEDGRIVYTRDLPCLVTFEENFEDSELVKAIMNDLK